LDGEEDEKEEGGLSIVGWQLCHVRHETIKASPGVFSSAARTFTKPFSL
jgi:hypothetical protein